MTPRDIEDSSFRSASEGIGVLEVSGGEDVEIHAVFRPMPRENGEFESPQELYRRIAGFLAARGVRALVQERCYARCADWGRITEARAQAYNGAGIARGGEFCFVGQEPCAPSCVAGVQIWASRDAGAVVSLLKGGEPVGTVFCRGGARFTWIPCVGPGLDADRALPRGDHAVSMFDEAGRMLALAGLRFTDVVRTWIYLPKLLDWYDEFNAARRAVFRREGLLDGDNPPAWLPASTGIQGSCPHGCRCTMGLLALSRDNGAPLAVEMVDSPGQCEAFAYGSAFSRAVEVRDSAISRMFVSGTASIARDGATVHTGDIEKQVAHTLGVIRDLLGARGHDFTHTAEAVAFLKSADYAPVFRRLAAQEGLNAAFVIETLADVCRDDLLVEIELLSIRPLA